MQQLTQPLGTDDRNVQSLDYFGNVILSYFFFS
jgi:hypothetical protein